jgi:Flp pilus assembly protein TadB
MHTVTSFHSSDVAPDRISAIMVEYLALERARVYRRLFVTRFGLLAFIVALIGFGLHWLPAAGSSAGVMLCSVPPTWAWVAELRCDRRLARSLKQIPAGAQIIVPPRA